MLADDGSNWAIYKNQVAQILSWQSLHDHLTNAEMPSSYTSNESVDDATDRWERGEAIVNYHIIMSLPDSVLLGVEGTTVKDMWDKLNRTFDRWPGSICEGNCTAKIAAKRKTFEPSSPSSTTCARD
jgi:hypothetical protein